MEELNKEKEDENSNNEEEGIEELTVIITTSAIKSHPSTELIEEVINSFKQCSGLYNTKKIIICDGFIPSSKSSYKQGKLSPFDASNYQKYLNNIKERFIPSCDVIIRDSRCGFASNVRYCLTHKVKTKYVMIVQHDMTFIRGVNVRSIVRKMIGSDVNYIGFPSPSVMKLYTTYSNCKNFRNELLSFVAQNLSSPIPPSHLTSDLLVNNNTDDDNDNDVSDNVNSNNDFNIIGDDENDCIDKKDINIENDMKKSGGGIRLKSNYGKRYVVKYYQQKYGLKLIPLLFWYDRTHIANVDYYNNFVFGKKHQIPNSNYKIKVNNFIEDSFGTFVRQDISARGFDGFLDYNCFMYLEDYDESLDSEENGDYYDPNENVTMHLNGRRYMTDDTFNEVFGDEIINNRVAKKIKKENTNYKAVIDASVFDIFE